MKFYNDDKYWNHELKGDFVAQTRSLWKKKASYYDGTIFNLSHHADEETTLTVR